MNKEDVKAAMYEYLKSKGWPNVPNPNRFVIDQLDDMFKYLLDKGLVKEEHYEAYLYAATIKYTAGW